MKLFQEFSQTFLKYCQEIWFILAIGFLISGIFYKFIPTRLVEKHLGEKGFKPILYSAFIGTLLPVCCMGSLPIAVTLRRKGASLGAVFAFLVATPSTSISALFVCWKLLGLRMTIFIFFVIIVMAITIGIVLNGINWHHAHESAHGQKDGCCANFALPEDKTNMEAFHNLKDALHYAFIILPKEMGLEILIGIAVASFVNVFDPFQHFIHDYLTGFIGYIFILIIGLLTYVCSTASVPMADAFLQSGMSYGQAICYLIVGPITSYSTILVIKKDFGSRILAIYLGIICILSLLSGLLYDAFAY